MNHVQRFYELQDTPKEQAIYLGQHLGAITANIKGYLKNKDEVNKLYRYMITFTLKEKMSTSDINKAINFIKSQFNDRPALKIKQAVMVQELTKEGVEHWHVVVSSRKSISKDRFNYFTKIYGFVKIQKNIHNNIWDGLNYIAKTSTPETLVDS